tara:strand:- start:4968 stop:6332 length:1365 start_codon:yes stop_codon:yes gene_type:complete
MRLFVLLAAPILAFLLGLLLSINDYSSAICWTAGVTFLCAIWWVTEPIPMPVTSILPMAIFPLVGVLSSKEVGEAYGSPLILLYLGGFMLSMAMEKSGAHRRIALGMINIFGAGGKGIVYGFMAAAAFLSMWISNTATSLMLLPIALAVLESSKDTKLSIALLLGIAYACNVGGLGTPIGTPPNLIFMQVYQETTGIQLSFISWMKWGIPVVVIFIPIIGIWLTRNLSVREKLIIPSVGSWRDEEKRTLAVFFVTALAWMTRVDPFGGWSEWFNLPHANDASVALLAAAVMFMIPNGDGDFLLNWKSAVKIPWGILLLFSGGICIASAFVSSGISQLIGEFLAQLSGINIVILIALICLSVTFLTEITSNTATTALLMPVLAAAGVGAGIDPSFMMIPAALSASCAFMLPVATGPNAVIFSSGRIPIKTMTYEGIILNFIGAIVITIVCFLVLV